ncbi:MAG: hypothetical protein LBN09_05250 [Clostridioides sp.]|jgi:hypothetical protein|nr:hypothetical protein [Clostridioides sp.]
MKKFEFIEKPFMLDDDLSLAIVDKRVTKKMKNSLKNKNIEIIETVECKNVYESIKYHPDIAVCSLGDGNIVVEPTLYGEYKKLLDEFCFNIIKGETKLGSKYPSNIAYNTAIFGEYAIHNFNYTDKTILEYVAKNKLNMINVAQGYSKCSICIVDDNSIITSDAGIYKAVQNTGIDCLLIEEGHIDLFDMNHGFIGGCSGLISRSELAFFGDIRRHPSYSQIKNFVYSKEKDIAILSDEHLLDLGSIVPLATKRKEHADDR